MEQAEQAEREADRRVREKLRKEQAAAESLGALAKARSKSKYKERGDAASCGDFMALAFKEAFHTEDGALDIDGLAACLKQNKVEEPKVDRERNGWRGRFRMIAGLKLRMVARKNGFVVINGMKIQAPGAKTKQGRKAKASEAAS